MRSLERYQNAAVWCNFQNIEGIDTGHDPGLLGDVNNDNHVNISDVASLINYLLSEDASGLNLDVADVNNDSKISIGDFTVLINYLLSGSWE